MIPRGNCHGSIKTADIFDFRTLLKELLIFLSVNKLGKYDYYSRVFENFSTEKGLSLAYGMVKTQISYIMELQPAFESLSEIISFKQKKKRAIKDLQEEVSHLEALIKEGASEAVLQKVIQDVRSANESLIKGTATKRIARVATYCSVPIALTEALLFGTPYSSIISVVGTVAQLTIDLKNRQSDWLFVARYNRARKTRGEYIHSIGSINLQSFFAWPTPQLQLKEVIPFPLKRWVPCTTLQGTP